MSITKDLETKLERLQVACIQVSGVLDTGARDPTWHETQELENAALEYGRALRAAVTPTNKPRGPRARRKK